MFQLVFLELAEILPPAPGISVLAQILAVGITVFYNRLLLSFNCNSVSRWIAHEKCTLLIKTSDGKLVLSAKPSSPCDSGFPIEKVNRICS